ncbi:hypothetical protein [Alcanivorax sp.]|uniref:hypothetical protein n=1 Tax=Alcanivorax sp. TaxID=1872427 RepID=UPI000C394E05|nr:hypothetical protein [Alcanivorax sp.]MBU83831.1 hypothetical protein [Alcanivorax sp.]|tara:strand:+ start:398 stop:745 length:348 start_codon:yes stop_codon:yes gene_type:complete
MHEDEDNYRNLALSALFKGLIDCEFESDVAIEVEKDEILDAFNYSGDIIRSNLGKDRYRMMADDVFETCVRLTRCLFFPKDARTIVLRGKEYEITAEQQLEVLRRNVIDLRQRES